MWIQDPPFRYEGGAVSAAFGYTYGPPRGWQVYLRGKRFRVLRINDVSDYDMNDYFERAEKAQALCHDLNAGGSRREKALREAGR